MGKGSLQGSRRGRTFWEDSRTNAGKETDQALRVFLGQLSETKEAQSQAAAGAKLMGVTGKAEQEGLGCAGPVPLPGLGQQTA